ncbi:protein LSM14 homolog B isoform X4 [Tribolium castaneum]|uniref:protein LSM14 homolog B isoform X4 n=1 Tax=Tribolium castaneum TaxID=7070 RepID=UPI00046BF836|nr:PREDICTED: protein LSM14 homolog B isoform X1 [Tribolium castaneum]|eukprot:XP_008198980.1 PREDICTED: protein LSM14 homolog B isoform X1 [Tribolium castaneum]
MSAGMPEIGSKISLISKADIRYEGRLFTVDPKECTIALSSVRSFGTEDRETPYPVPAQNQVYDYILFRGSDIKDIRVVNNVAQPLNDPAIMQLSVPPTLGQQQFQNHPMMGHPLGPQMGQFASGYGAMGSMAGLSSGMVPGMGMSRDPRGLAGSLLDIIGGGSRSTTPASLRSRKSPTNDQGTQAGGAGKRDDKKTPKPIQPPGQRNQQRKSTSQERKNSRGDGPQDYQRNQNRQPQMRTQNQGGPQGSHLGPQQITQQRGGWTNRGPMRQRGRPRGGFKPNQGQPTPGNKAKNTLKFENDYDFEQANTEFEELRSQLAKVKVEETSKTELNGDVDKKDDSGNETGAGENEPEEEHEVYYDKSKSFFDKISCEAVERAKGKSQRTDWRTERKLNSETFGVAATRRGNFRGRGGFRGMGYRGGYRGGFRPQQRRDQQQQQQQGNRPGQNQQNDVQRPTTNSQPPASVPAATGK